MRKDIKSCKTEKHGIRSIKEEEQKIKRLRDKTLQVRHGIGFKVKIKKKNGIDMKKV